MSTITKIEVQSINDSRGNPTLLVTASVGDVSASFSVPSGASMGTHEAYELRDHETKSVLPAIQSIHEMIAPTVVGMSALDQRTLDSTLCALDRDLQKRNIGGNSTLGVSGAVLRLGALLSDLPVYEYLRNQFPDAPMGPDAYPHCYFNLINGGKHAQTDLAFQEYHIVPDCGSVADNLVCAKAVYEELGKIIEKDFPGTTLGDEGGYALKIKSVTEPLGLLKQAVVNSGFDGKVRYALDVAASSFFTDGGYSYDGSIHNAEELATLYADMQRDYPMISIEDPFNEEAFADFAQLRTKLPEVKIIGDDLTVTNKGLLASAAKSESIDGLIIKPNQIGTVSETVDTIAEAHKRGLVCIVSHRSGETMDDTIADIAVAFHCFGLKAGAPGPKERMVKYERLLAIANK